MRNRLPFKRPLPIPAPKKVKDFYGFSLSMDDNPVKFLVPVRLRGMFLICPVFSTEADAWKEAAYLAVEAGRDPGTYVAKA
jgi:hypothetical protein